MEVFIDNENYKLYNFIMNEKSWKSRWSIEQRKALLLEQFAAFCDRDIGIEREDLAQLVRVAALPHAVIVSGLRRVGKSTLLAQFARRLGETAFYYVNFEDDRFLGFEASDADDLHRLLIELFGERHIFIIDEIQNVPEWETFVRRFLDLGFKFYISGSNAALLSRELGSRLTGRYVPVELFPFSFSEFLRFRGNVQPELSRMTTVDRAMLQRWLDAYCVEGGIPDPLKYPEVPLRQWLYDDVIYRDIATRYQISEVRALKELAFYLLSNPASLISFNKLRERLQLGSVNTVKNYIEYLENSWLFFSINVYDYSVKRQQIAPKKTYAIDTGLVNSVGFSFSPNTGKLWENLVFLALRRKTRNIHYVALPGGHEVDFYVPDVQLLIQVTQSLDRPETRDREIRALSAGMRALGLNHGLILTDASAPSIQIGETRIDIVALSEWLLSD